MSNGKKSFKDRLKKLGEDVKKTTRKVGEEIEASHIVEDIDAGINKATKVVGKGMEEMGEELSKGVSKIEKKVDEVVHEKEDKKQSD